MRSLKSTFSLITKAGHFVAAFLGLACATWAQPLVTLPSPLPTSADPSQYTPLFSSSVRIQDVYGAIYFTNGPVTISQLRFQRRPGSSPFTNVSTTVRIALSTTTRAPDALSTTFSSNIGTDQVVVFNGTISLTSASSASLNPSTQPFDIVIPLSSAFNFDPSKGNLLVDFKEDAGPGIPFGVLNFNISGDKISRVTTPDSTALTGGADTGCEAIQIVAIPASSGDIVIYPNGGGFTNSTQVSLYTKMTGGSLRYTLDGSDPTPNSLLYTNSFTITDTALVKARYFINGFPGTDIYGVTFNKADPILFSPAITLFTNSVQVALVNTLGSGTIHFTLDGSNPTLNSPTYTSSFLITNSTTVSAALYLNTYPISYVYVTNYSRVYAFANDGISAAWRQQYFGAGYLTDPRAAADADPDNDGSTNLQEFTGGSDPLNPNSGFKLTVKGIPLLNWASVVNANYNILRRPDLASSSFSVIATIKATNSVSTFIDTGAGAGSSQFFYTIQAVP